MSALALLLGAACGEATTLLPGPDLSGTGAEQPGADLAGLDLIGVDLARADLTSAGNADLAQGHAGWSGHTKVALTSVGCTPMLAGDVIVIANGSQVTIVQRFAPLTGSILLDLHTAPGNAVQLSTPAHAATMDTIDVVAGGATYINTSAKTPDTIAGLLTIHAYDETSGVLRLGLDGVVLEDLSSGNTCRFDGTVETDGKDF